MAAATFIKSASEPRGFPPDDAAEVAFVGRSNSGKSSAINAVTGVRKLARVSKTPGRTQLLNFFEAGAGRRIVDLPGYGFARVAPEVRRRWRGLLEAYFRGRRGLRAIVLTVDIRRGLKELDEVMIDWASALDLPVLVLLTKADKLGRGEIARRRNEVEKGASGRHADVRVLPFSALTALGVDEARAAVEAWLGGPPKERKPRAWDSGDMPGA
ncbi:MAG TPA: ribosome biogenesis GTP-binding protein YihA/YsxC [Gammaproteobacteria bacterium]|nr:ribosome biogenesis GTP-binding protein YihA/YsxC [Gammaproteobacteria bacterium]